MATPAASALDGLYTLIGSLLLGLLAWWGIHSLLGIWRRWRGGSAGAGSGASAAPPIPGGRSLDASAQETLLAATQRLSAGEE